MPRCLSLLLLTACGPQGAVFGVDEPPSTPAIRLDPPAPVTGDALQVEQLERSVDPEEHTVVLRFAWTRDGESVTDLDGASVPVGRVRRGETWEVTVTPDDGAVLGAPVSAAVTIGDAGPTLGRVTLSPASPRIGDVIEVVATGEDPEDDVLAWTATWSVGGVVVPSDEPLRLTEGFVHGDVVAVDVVGSDGSLSTEVGHAEVTVANTPPTAPEIELLPAEPRPVRDDLRCRIVTPGTDADDDPLTTTFSWERDGVPFLDAEPGVASSTVPAALAGAGHTWRCFAATSDGLAASPKAEVAVDDRSSGVGEAFLSVEVTATATLAFTLAHPTDVCGQASCDCTATLHGTGTLLYADRLQDVFVGGWTVVGGDCPSFYGSPRTVADAWLVPGGTSSYLTVVLDPAVAQVTGLRVHRYLADDHAVASLTPNVLWLPSTAALDGSTTAHGDPVTIGLGAGGADGSAAIAWTVRLVGP